MKSEIRSLQNTVTRLRQKSKDRQPRAVYLVEVHEDGIPAYDDHLEKPGGPKKCRILTRVGSIGQTAYRGGEINVYNMSGVNLSGGGRALAYRDPWGDLYTFAVESGCNFIRIGQSGIMAAQNDVQPMYAQDCELLFVNGQTGEIESFDPPQFVEVGNHCGGEIDGDIICQTKTIDGVRFVDVVCCDEPSVPDPP